MVAAGMWDVWRVGLQAALVAAVGAVTYRVLLPAAPTKAHRRIQWLTGVGLASVLVVSSTFLVASTHSPQARMTGHHLVSFLLSGSTFLALSRVLTATIIGHDAQLPPRTLLTLPKYLLAFFTAPLSLRSVAPETSACQRYRGRWDEVPGRLLLKIAILFVTLRYGVALHVRWVDQSLWYCSMVGNVVFYLLLSGTEDAFALVLELGAGLHFWPSFDAPWLANSFRDFWSFRWHTPFRDMNVAIVRAARAAGWPTPIAISLIYIYTAACHAGQLYLTIHEVPLGIVSFFLVAGTLALFEDPLWRVLDPLLRCAPSKSGRHWLRRAIVLGVLCALSPLFWFSFWEHRFLQALCRVFDLM
ncbi:uncharacterized protein MONBRDRAFT_5055 [Monosiga brevicollis MX1]|uniref:Wax synthase domain-containing protein n=1 Tax=Monosiga brevicollis TaxID=81824 RepID=A9UPS3_MONBE|nr:uncharacterized protein MONBRDRAFT_5055 [Monosiga brevicollis MX1]EDQ92920.1 predicted protein [Monosiga brevicollis MX1]|eukprot:XP_001742682.1 hypothetical protein [Monosiga brevicollis MX1]